MTAIVAVAVKYKAAIAHASSHHAAAAALRWHLIIADDIDLT